MTLPAPINGPRTARLAAWADRHLLPGVLVLLLALDVAAGLNWALAPARSLTSPAYDAAKQLAPMSVHGLVLAAAAILAGSWYLSRGRSWLTGWLTGPLTGGLWVFWTVLFALGSLGRPGASWAGAIFAACFAGLHLLLGLALTHHPAPAPLVGADGRS